MSIWCGRLNIPWVGKSVGSGFLSTNCRLMVKTRLFRFILDRPYKSSRMFLQVISLNFDSTGVRTHYLPPGKLTSAHNRFRLSGQAPHLFLDRNSLEQLCIHKHQRAPKPSPEYWYVHRVWQALVLKGSDAMAESVVVLASCEEGVEFKTYLS